MALVESVARHYSKLLNRTIDPLNQVAISVGATEAIFAIMQAMINDGDEVIIIEPAFDMLEFVLKKFIPFHPVPQCM